MADDYKEFFDLKEKILKRLREDKGVFLEPTYDGGKDIALLHFKKGAIPILVASGGLVWDVSEAVKTALILSNASEDEMKIISKWEK